MPRTSAQAPGRARRALVIALALCGPATAADLLVPQQYPTLAAAFVAAQDGDRVLVAPGFWSGGVSVDLAGRRLTLASTDGADTTRLAGPLFFFGSGGIDVEGFLITRALDVVGPDASVTRCAFRFSEGLEVRSAQVLVERCDFRDTLFGFVALTLAGPAGGGGVGVVRETFFCHNTSGELEIDSATIAVTQMEVLIQSSCAVGGVYCAPNAMNSTGLPAMLYASGSAFAGPYPLTLTTDIVPANEFGYYLGSRVQGFVAHPGGSSGNLCLGGSIGRFVDVILPSGNGLLARTIQLDDLAQPTGWVAGIAGETWNFQAWFRDGTTSNFSNAVSLTLQ